MKKIPSLLSGLFIFVAVFSFPVFAQGRTHTVVPGDTMWKISLKYQLTLRELISLNPQIENPDLIYPNEKITIPGTSTTTDTPNTTISNIENRVVQLVNQERAKQNLPALKANQELSKVARLKSQDMLVKNYFSHTSPTYGSPFKMMETFGIKYSAAGENIAMGQRSPEEVMNSWMNSPGHRANILSRAFTEIGVGYAKNSAGKNYWTQMFIKPL
jgi:uncharacterized YkwD family protein/spore coat assembly protein SafA